MQKPHWMEFDWLMIFKLHPSATPQGREAYPVGTGVCSTPPPPILGLGTVLLVGIQVDLKISISSPFWFHVLNGFLCSVLVFVLNVLKPVSTPVAPHYKEWLYEVTSFEVHYFCCYADPECILHGFFFSYLHIQGTRYLHWRMLLYQPAEGNDLPAYPNSVFKSSQPRANKKEAMK